ncbi:hypothetical protein GCM10022384_63370 [Streptomyces marokkonensis]|uniref:Uncharacterized protein n=1 Tax=Streptomyces marokkonensis TaxID=324855 RepID=A0ABP7SAS5_9ACTN
MATAGSRRSRKAGFGLRSASYGVHRTGFAKRRLSRCLPLGGEFSEQLDEAKCMRETPARAGWEQAVRTQGSFTTSPARTALLVSRLNQPGRRCERQSLLT